MRGFFGGGRGHNSTKPTNKSWPPYIHKWERSHLQKNMGPPKSTSQGLKGEYKLILSFSQKKELKDIDTSGWTEKRTSDEAWWSVAAVFLKGSS